MSEAQRCASVMRRYAVAHEPGTIKRGCIDATIKELERQELRIAELEQQLEAARKDAERLNKLDKWASEGVVDFGFEFDGGVFCAVSPMGGEQISIREKNDVRELIDAVSQ